MNLQKIIVFMGAPGSGKGTQTKLLAERLGFAYFSTGELSREYAKQDTELGKRIKDLIDNGIILPIDIIRQIFIKKFESLMDSPGIILDGYPRTIDQAELLKEIMAEKGIPSLQAIFLDVDKAQLLKRLSLRGAAQQRADDSPDKVEKRFDEYMNKTAAVKEYYESAGLLTHINGEREITAVHNEIMGKVANS